MIGRWSKGPCFAVVHKRIEGREYLFTGAGKDLYILDVSNPSDPIEINKIPTVGMVYGLFISGDYLYVANGENGVIIFDITDPAHPESLGHCDTPGRAWKVEVNYPYAYVADLEGGLRIIDVSNPYSPQEIGYFGEPGSLPVIWSVDVKDPYAYLAGSPYSRIIDISDPSNPIDRGKPWGYARDGQDIEVHGDYLYYVRSSGLSLFDVSNVDSIKVIGGYPAPYWTWGLNVSGDTVFVTDQKFGLRVIDVSDPTKPTREIGYYNTPGQAEDVYFAYPYAYVADGWQGLVILECYELGIQESLREGLSASLHFLPNPSKGLAKIHYTLPKSSLITLSLYDISGRRIKILDKGYKTSGSYSLFFDAQEFPKGIYFLSLKLKDRSFTQKIILN